MYFNGELALFCTILLMSTEKSNSLKPNIIVIIGDDLGYNDVGFHGSSQILTPNIDALAYNGIVLNKLYTQSACSPSRAAFLTGNYPLRSGLQGYPIYDGENLNLPLDMPTMAEQMRNLGYKTHLVGKWHLGYSHRNNTPIRRGFDTHFGCWGGHISYFGHNATYKSTTVEGLDFRDQFDNVWSEDGQYVTEVLTKRALKVIDDHEGDDSMFLVVAHTAAHIGRNNSEQEVPDVDLALSKYRYIQNPSRRLYADGVNRLDDSIGKVMRKLSERKLLEKSVVLFFSDNGGSTAGPNANFAENWPLRGTKCSDFEGGVKGTAAIYSPLFQKTGYINNELIHLTDFLPTFYEMAGGNPKNLEIDGISQWRTLLLNESTNRTFILLNIDDILNTSAIIDGKGKYKLVTGTYTDSYTESIADRYYGTSGRGPEVPSYDIKAVLSSDTNIAISQLVNEPLTEEKIKTRRASLDLSGCKRQYPDKLKCVQPYCLFDLEKDPCESTNLILKKSKIAERMLKKIRKFYKVLVPQPPIRGLIDPASNPENFNNTWCTWLDGEWCVFEEKRPAKASAAVSISEITIVLKYFLLSGIVLTVSVI